MVFNIFVLIKSFLSYTRYSRSELDQDLKGFGSNLTGERFGRNFPIKS